MAPIEHGTARGYNDEMCRCPQCKMWKLENWPEVLLVGREREQVDTSWMKHATCRKEKHPTEVFFEKPSAATQICGRCPVTKQCRQYAEINEEQYGVWGGISFYRGKPLGTPNALRSAIARATGASLTERRAMRELTFEQLQQRAKELGIL